MKIGVIGAMKIEVDSIIEKLENPEEKTISGFRFVSGKYKDKELIVSESSIGKVNSALSTQNMINEYDPDFIINTGIAGGLDERLDVLSIVISEKLTFHDLDHEIMKDFFPFTEYFYADKKAVKLAEKILEDLGIHGISGTIVTGDLFVEDSKKKKQLKEDFDGLCTEMEGAAIANTCFINDVPFIVLRAISDMADDGGHMTYEEFKEKAAEESTKIVLNFVEQYN